MANLQSTDAIQLAGKAANPTPTLPDHAGNHAELKLRFSQILQSSLDTSIILRLFFDNATTVLPLRSLDYRHEQLQESIQLGKTSRHRSQYQLFHAGVEPMGELAFSFSKRFNDYELELLETLISCLILPLRNALLYQQALQAALRDPLTQVGNRVALDATLDRELIIAKRHERSLSLLVIDIDRFKSINDRFGHSVGDEILKIVGEELQSRSRATDLTCRPFRFGGEEFVMVLSNTEAMGATIIAERLRRQIEALTPVIDGNAVNVTVSIGIASLQNGDTRQSLFKRADAALYRAKNDGRNRVCLDA